MRVTHFVKQHYVIEKPENYVPAEIENITSSYLISLTFPKGADATLPVYVGSNNSDYQHSISSQSHKSIVTCQICL